MVTSTHQIFKPEVTSHKRYLKTEKKANLQNTFVCSQLDLVCLHFDPYMGWIQKSGYLVLYCSDFYAFFLFFNLTQVRQLCGSAELNACSPASSEPQ